MGRKNKKDFLEENTYQYFFLQYLMQSWIICVQTLPFSNNLGQQCKTISWVSICWSFLVARSKLIKKIRIAASVCHYSIITVLILFLIRWQYWAFGSLASIKCFHNFKWTTLILLMFIAPLGIAVISAVTEKRKRCMQIQTRICIHSTKLEDQNINDN